MKSKALGTRRQLLSFLGGVPIAMGSFEAASEQPKILVLSSYFSPETLAHKAAQYFADEATENANGKFIVPVDATHYISKPFKLISEASALAHYYAAIGASLEPIFKLSALPMLVASFDDAETLLQVARPYYTAALARYDQFLLAAEPWRPGSI